jgi:glycyl-tRNA synthetase beta chain
LTEHKVILDPEKRKETILSQAKKLLDPLHLTVINDEALLNEVAGLVEYPVVYLGQIDPKYMYLPKEVLLITLKHHQRYLMVEDKDGKLAPYYLIVANIEASDNGQEIRHGNGKVLRARLEDAIFHFEHDKKQKLETFVENLKSLTYHQQIGSVYDKVQSVMKLAEKIAAFAKADVEKVKRATLLCKADLVSNMVKEFPELQGVMGYYYAVHAKEPKEVSLAIKEHYKPQGPNDSLPSELTGAVVALADKLDTLNQMFAINIKPTGSKDPFALRRAAIGILRSCEHYKLSFDLQTLGIREDVIQFINERKENLNN